MDNIHSAMTRKPVYRYSAAQTNYGQAVVAWKEWAIRWSLRLPTQIFKAEVRLREQNNVWNEHETQEKLRRSP